MPRTIKTKAGRVLGLPSAEEETAIAAGIAADPASAALTDAQWAAVRPTVRRGRPPLPHKRPTLNMRIDADVLAALKAHGPGWQTRVNALLRKAVGLG